MEHGESTLVVVPNFGSEDDIWLTVAVYVCVSEGGTYIIVRHWTKVAEHRFVCDTGRGASVDCGKPAAVDLTCASRSVVVLAGI